MASTVKAARKPSNAKQRTKDLGERLLLIAARMFRERGYTAASIRDIAELAQIEPSGLYYYYPSKEALLEAVLDRSINSVMTEVRAALEELPADASSQDRFRVAIGTHVRAIVLHGDFALASRRVIGQIPAPLRRKHAAMRAAYGDYWQELFSRAAQLGDFRDNARLGLARMFLMGALNWTTEWFDPKKKSPEEIAAIFCDFLFDGLGRSPSKPRRKTGRAS